MKNEQPKLYNTRGLSVWLVIGSYGGFKIKVLDKQILFRVCIGWVAFTITRFDVENVLANAMETVNYLDKCRSD
jgi:hypothetical protein